MDFFRHHDRDFHLMKHALKFNILSIIMFLLAVFFLATRGLHFSVEFTGGTLLEITFPEAPHVEEIRQTLIKHGINDAEVQRSGTSHDIMIRLPNRAASTEESATGEDTNDINQRLSDQVMQALSDGLQGSEIPVLHRNEFVGPQVGDELATNGIMALVFVLAGVMIYLAMRFEWRFSISAIIAHFHDVIIILGFFALFQWEFSLSVLAATLAVVGYSVNESVIVFDRVRETFRKRRDLNTAQVLDHAITQTMSRTVITHTSTLMIAISMLIFGGDVLRYFALALTIGIIFGVYSSIFVSSPIVMWLGVTREHFIPPPKKKDASPDGAVV